MGWGWRYVWSKKSFKVLENGFIGWEEFKRCSWLEEVEGEEKGKVFQEKGRILVKIID